MLRSTISRTAPPASSGTKLRMLEDDAPSDMDTDDFILDIDVEAAPSFSEADEPERLRLKGEILQMAAATGRGVFADENQQRDIQMMVDALESLSPSLSPVEDGQINGRWQLLYTSTDIYSLSPLLMPLKLTPLAQIEGIYQSVDLSAGEVVFEVTVNQFPGITGTLVSTSRAIVQGPERLSLSLTSSGVKGGSALGRLPLDMVQLDVPVEQALSALQQQIPETFLDTFYLDDNMRISRSDSGNFFIFKRS